jgi:hypothetical protein
MANGRFEFYQSDIPDFFYGGKASMNQNIIVFRERNDDVKIILIRCGYIPLCDVDGCGCGVDFDVTKINTIITKGVQEIVQNKVSFGSARKSGFGYYVRDLISNLIEKYDNVNYHGSESESVIFRHEYNLDMELYGLPRYNERKERAIFMIKRWPALGKYGVPSDRMCVFEEYTDYTNMEFTDEFVDGVEDYKSGVNINSKALCFKNNKIINRYSGYTSYIKFYENSYKDAYNYDVMDEIIYVHINTTEVDINLDFPFEDISYINNDDDRNLIYYSYNRGFLPRVDWTIENEIQFEEFINYILDRQILMYESRQFRNIITRYSITDMDMYESGSEDSIDIALFSASNIRNFSKYNKIKDMKNILFMFPSAEYLRYHLIGSYSKKYKRYLIQDEGYEHDFGLYNDEAYYLKKNWIDLNQLSALLNPNFKLKTDLFYDFGSSDGYKWCFITDLFNLDVQESMNSATILIKSISSYIRVKYRQHEDDLHKLRLDIFSSISGFTNLSLDKKSKYLTIVNGEKVDVSGHIVNSILMTSVKSFDWYGYFRQIRRNIESTLGQVSVSYVPESPEGDDVLWHRKHEDIMGVLVGTEMLNYFEEFVSFDSTYILRGFKRLRFPNKETVLDVVSRYNYIPEGDWQSVLLSYFSSNISKDYSYFAKISSENNYIYNLNFFEKHIDYLREGVSRKRSLLSRAVNIFINNGYNSIIDIGGADTVHTDILDVLDRKVLDIVTGFNLEEDYNNIPEGAILFSDVLHHIKNPFEVLNSLTGRFFVIIDHLVTDPAVRSAIDIYHILGGYDIGKTYLDDRIMTYDLKFVALDNDENNFERFIAYSYSYPLE